MGKIFTITGAINNIVSKIVDASNNMDNLQEVYRKFTDIGKDIGEIISAILAYKGENDTILKRFKRFM